MTNQKARVKATKEGYGLGFSYVPLRGKIPTQKRWQKRDRESVEEALAWAKKGNVGIRTGQVSGGLVVVDIDTGADISNLDLPDTVTVRTGSGGTHMYYRTNEVVGNSAGKIGPHVDVRGDGGQVVAVGCIHPDTNKLYEYIVPPSQRRIALLPRWIIQVLKPKERKKHNKDFTPGIDRYAQAALEKEIDIVRNADEGMRNNTLNRAAFNLGQLVGAGRLTRAEVETALLDATDLPENEAIRTINSGLERGSEKPRHKDDPNGTPPTREGGTATSTQTDPAYAEEGNTILIPGVHSTVRGYFEIGWDVFCEAVLNCFPVGAIYRRGGLPVEVVGDPGRKTVVQLSVDKMRILIDKHVRLAAWVKKSKQEKYEVRKTASRDLSRTVLAAATFHHNVRDLNLLTNYPIFTANWDLAKPGWHKGVYYDEPPGLQNMKPRVKCDVLDELLVDFPFATEADKQNFIGLLITPLIRPALYGNTPMHLIKSSLPRTGKTKLAEEVLGGIYRGAPTPAMQLSGNEDERDKRVLSLLLRGDTMVHLDNVSAYIDSPTLASLITSKTYSGRILGQSEMKNIDNVITVVATGNNPNASGEIVRRSVPIVLQPETDAPELRGDFVHPQCFEYVLTVRRPVLGCLIGMVNEWYRQGRPPGSKRMGGFESWAATVGGILEAHGMNAWLTNWRTWIKETDPEGEDLKEFVELWNEKYPYPVHARDLMNLAEDEGFFGNVLNRSRTEQGKLTIFSTRILGRYVNAPVGDWIIRRETRRQYVLERHERKEDDGQKG